MVRLLPLAVVVLGCHQRLEFSEKQICESSAMIWLMLCSEIVKWVARGDGFGDIKPRMQK